MTSFRPFLGETSDRKQAFPGIKSLDMRVRQDVYKMQNCSEWQRDSRFTLDSVPSTIACVNPRCQQGGLGTQSIILNYGNFEEKEFHCHGHEGSPKGRNKGDPCTNSFVVSLTIEENTPG